MEDNDEHKKSYRDAQADSRLCCLSAGAGESGEYLKAVYKLPDRIFSLAERAAIRPCLKIGGTPSGERFDLVAAIAQCSHLVLLAQLCWASLRYKCATGTFASRCGGKFSQAGCRPARKFNAERRKKIRRLGVLTFFKQGLNYQEYERLVRAAEQKGDVYRSCGYGWKCAAQGA